MLWITLAALLVPALVVYLYMHTGKPRRPGYTGNGDIYGATPDAVEDLDVSNIHSFNDLHSDIQVRAMRATSSAARRREMDGF